MKKLTIFCFAVMLLTVFSAVNLFCAEMTGPGKTRSAQTERSMIQTVAGRVKAVNVEKKTITIAAMMETEYHLSEGETLFKETDIDEMDITFDASTARFQGVKDITGIATGRLIRAGYDKKGNTYVAHTVLVIHKKESRTSVQTFLGIITAVDPANQTMTLNATMEGEFFLHEKNTVLKETIIDQKDITFNTAKATVVGNKAITPGDTVRIAYDKEKNDYVAHTVLKIEKKGK